MKTVKKSLLYNFWDTLDELWYIAQEKALLGEHLPVKIILINVVSWFIMIKVDSYFIVIMLHTDGHHWHPY